MRMLICAFLDTCMNASYVSVCVHAHILCTYVYVCVWCMSFVTNCHSQFVNSNLHR